MNKILYLLLMISETTYAASAITVHTGDVITKEFNEGTLLDKEQANKIKDQLIERDAFEKENKSYEKSIELYKANEKLYQDQNSLLLNRNIELTKTVNDTRQTSDWVKVGYFVLGVTITGAAVWGASKLAK